MPRKTTLEDLENRVRDAIEADEDWLVDVADSVDPPQILDNVKHMSFFRRAAMRRLAEDFKKYRHLLPTLEAT